MTSSIISIDVYFGFFDGEEYCYGPAEADARATVESCLLFGEPDPADPYNDHLGNTWATGDGDRGWRIVKRSVTALRYDAEFSGAPDETCHVSWKCPYCECDLDEHVEFEDKGPLLGCCSWTPNENSAHNHANAHEIWFLLTW